MVKNYEKILHALLKSFTNGNIISLKIKGSQKNLLTTVQEIRGNSLVILNPVSVYGSQLEDRVIHITEIDHLRIYAARYSPVYVRIRELKNNIDTIKKSMTW